MFEKIKRCLKEYEKYCDKLGSTNFEYIYSMTYPMQDMFVYALYTEFSKSDLKDITNKLKILMDDNTPLDVRSALNNKFLKAYEGDNKK